MNVLRDHFLMQHVSTLDCTLQIRFVLFQICEFGLGSHLVTTRTTSIERLNEKQSYKHDEKSSDNMQQGCAGKDLKQQSTWCFHVNHHLMTRHVNGKIRFQRTDREKTCKKRNHEPCKNTKTRGTKIFRSTVDSHEIFFGYLGTYDFQKTF